MRARDAQGGTLIMSISASMYLGEKGDMGDTGAKLAEVYGLDENAASPGDAISKRGSQNRRQMLVGD